MKASWLAVSISAAFEGVQSRYKMKNDQRTISLFPKLLSTGQGVLVLLLGKMCQT